jgi:hypothetical protein
MFCSNCGASIEGRFCSKCGSIVKGERSGDSGLVFEQTRNVFQTKPGAPTSGTAIAALICSFFIPLLGLILGIVSRNEIKNSKGEKGGDGLANAAIIFSAIFIVVYFFLILAWVGFIGAAIY